ncbi:MAG TPA: XVIPCD domain-containing protein [Xanthomonadaceae bacterium]|nr:XVIPCD domain-containing protein [Xanthomonadaceae bacterium]
MSDHPLYQQALAAITRRDAELGRESDAASRSIAIAGAALAARSGYERIDDIVFNVATGRLAAGERFFVLQGGRDDPAHLRASMLTRDALAATPEQQAHELAQLETVRTQARAVQEPQRQQAGPQIA